MISSETDETRVYTESAAKNMTDVLQSVIAGGTGSGAKVSGIDTAGKTGTTTSNRDGWFCGYTPYYTTAIWVGRDDNKEMASLSGASYPKSIWTRFMNAIHEGISGDKQLSGSGEADSGESVTTAAIRRKHIFGFIKFRSINDTDDTEHNSRNYSGSDNDNGSYCHYRCCDNSSP